MPIIYVAHSHHRLGPDYDRTTLNYLWSVMLYPDDLKRQKAAFAALCGAEINTYRQKAAAQPPRAVDFATLSRVTDAELSAQRHAPPAEDRNRRLRHGQIAGLILLNCLKDQLHAKIGMEAVKKDVSKRLEHLDGFGQTSLSTINNIIWPTFKNVAPLWTAHLLERKNSAKVQTDSFPCQLDRIHSFLARAEHIRKLGESSRPRQAVNTLLDPRTTWKVPANAFHIPSAGTGGTESAPDADRTDSVGSTHD